MLQHVHVEHHVELAQRALGLVAQHLLAHHETPAPGLGGARRIGLDANHGGVQPVPHLGREVPDAAAHVQHPGTPRDHAERQPVALTGDPIPCPYRSGSSGSARKPPAFASGDSAPTMAGLLLI